MSGNGKAWLPAKTMPKEIEFKARVNPRQMRDPRHAHMEIVCARCGTKEIRLKGAIKICLSCSNARHNKKWK